MPAKRHKRLAAPVAARKRTPGSNILDEHRRLKASLGDRRNPLSHREADKARRRVQSIEAEYRI